MTSSKKFATLLSYILSPTGVALFVILLILFFKMEPATIIDLIVVLISSIFFLSLLPIVGILYFVKRGKIDIWVSDKKTRTPFYILAILGYIIAVLFFYWMNFFDLFVLALAYLSVTGVVALINLKIKISSHCAGLTGPFTATLFIFGLVASILFIFLPLIIWARLQLNAHSKYQIIIGSFVGFFITSLVYLISYG